MLSFFVTILPFAPVLQRRAARLLAEDFPEIAGVSKAAGVADFGDRHPAVGKHLPGRLHAVASDIRDGRHVQVVLKRPVAFPLAQKSGLASAETVIFSA